jgi:hypothetical protein
VRDALNVSLGVATWVKVHKMLPGTKGFGYVPSKATGLKPLASAAAIMYGYINIQQLPLGDWSPTSEHGSNIKTIASTCWEDLAFQDAVEASSRAYFYHENGAFSIYNTGFHNSRHWVRNNFGLGMKNPPDCLGSA